ncbi:MAG: hybrid sensor histidine kinase/response regulator [Alphaproteobacteria bacterium PA2]|nr:MAG: hybrid sensor histidine kinase/response regulator [Alphaproteobacteria bacterium PA2]
MNVHADPNVSLDNHPRRMGWIGTTALAMGGSNQSLFLIAALFVGQGSIPGQGSAAVPLLIVGLILSWMAAPAWTELVLMSPNRVGGIAAVCTRAFRPYSSLLSALTGTCYWWGWVPTCGLTAIFSASAIVHWVLPGAPIPLVASAIIIAFTTLNLLGLKWVTAFAVPIAFASAILAFLAMLIPIFSGSVDWKQAFDFHLTTPFDGLFGQFTSIMAGLYLIGFAAPAFEAATCHVGETKNPNRNVPIAVFASGGMATVYFIFLPVVWLGTLGPGPLGQDLAISLGPVFAPLLGSFAKAAAIGFMMFNMFHGTLQPLAGASRALSQLSEDGLLPRVLGLRSSTDSPWVATLLTAGVSIGFMLIGDPIWLVAAANFTYLISVCMPNVAAWLLRRDAPEAERPYRAPKGTIALGLIASGVWLLSAIFGFQQFGLPTVLFGLAMAYSGAALYVWRKIEDRLAMGQSPFKPSLHVTLTGAMLLVLVLDGAGYLMAVRSIPVGDGGLSVALEDIFVGVALLTLAVGLVLPGIIAKSAEEIADRAEQMASGAVLNFSKAMTALGKGDLDAAHFTEPMTPMVVRSRDELGQMAASFNRLQDEVAIAAVGLEGAREGLRANRREITATNVALTQKIAEGELLQEQLRVERDKAEAASRAKSQFLAMMSHEIRTPLNAVLGMTQVISRSELSPEQRSRLGVIATSGEALLAVLNDLLDLSKIESGKLELEKTEVDIVGLVRDARAAFATLADEKQLALNLEIDPSAEGLFEGDPARIGQILANLVSNAVKFTEAGHVTISLSRPAESLILKVSDTGIGVSKEQQGRLFQKFSQADSSVTRRFGGTGLGLAIVNDLTDLMHGSVELDSRIGKGSTFTVTLPLPRLSQSAVDARWSQEAAGPPASLSTLRILVAEDNATNQLVLRTILNQFDVDPVIVPDGVEAVHQWQTNTWDVILMDVQMPQMDGMAACQMIRESEVAQGRSPTPIIALTANVMPDQIEMYLARGMTDVVAKPIQIERLLQVITDILDGPDAPAGAQATGTGGPPA